MSEEAPKDDGHGGKKKGSFLMPIIVVLVGCVSAALGFCLPMVLGPAKEHEPEHEEKVATEPTLAFVEFGEVVVNLDEGRLNRYLRINVTLCVDKAEHEAIDLLVKEQHPKLKGWLIAYLADKDMESVRGAAGQNRVRRDILDEFNQALFEHDTHKIQDVYFTEFNIQ